MNIVNSSDVAVGDYVAIQYFGEIGYGSVEGIVTKKDSIGIFGKHPAAHKHEWFVIYADIESILNYHTDYDLGI